MLRKAPLGSPEIYPQQEKMEEEYAEFQERASNHITQVLTGPAWVNVPEYPQYRELFSLFFDLLNQDPDDERGFTSVGAESNYHFAEDPLSYLQLLNRPSTLPPLTLVSLRDLRPRRESTLVDHLSNYTDQELYALIGEKNRFETRIMNLHSVALTLAKETILVLTGKDTGICNGKRDLSESEEWFFGHGVPMEDMDCFTLEELFSSWKVGEDGQITLFSPIFPTERWDTTYLGKIKEALQKTTQEVPEGLLETLDEVITLAHRQNPDSTRF